MKIAPGEIVAIQGLGGLGHLAVQYAAKVGLFGALSTHYRLFLEFYSKDMSHDLVLTRERKC